MRKGLIILAVGLACLGYAVPTLAAENPEAHVYFNPSGAQAGDMVTIKGRIRDGNTIRCLGASNVKIKSAAFSPYTTYVSTHSSTGFFQGEWKILGPAKPSAKVYARCRSILFDGTFAVQSGDLPDTGAPTLLTFSVGLMLTAVGCLMLIFARSKRVRPIGSGSQSASSGWSLRRLVIPRGARDRSAGRAEGSDTAATRKR